MANIKVDLKERSYPIVIGSGILADLQKYIGKLNKKQIVILTDHQVGSIYGHAVRSSIKAENVYLLQLPHGERHKTLSAAAAVYDKLTDLRIGRDALIVALGGGVIGDLAGFVAATYMRGIDFVQVPTTLLAMVDASIGGKTGVNHHRGKNLIGVFHQPKLVLIDVETLATLPPREIKNGLAEVLKYGIIKDPKIFHMLDGNPKATAAFWQKLVYLCARIKAEVVSIDERETSGYRMILNFGHTVGHALESLSEYRSYAHGEAVGFGMVAASLIALKMKLISVGTYDRITELVGKLKLPCVCGFKAGKIAEAIKLDKKVKNGRLRFVLPTAIGRVTIRDDVDEKVIKSALKELGCK